MSGPEETPESVLAQLVTGLSEALRDYAPDAPIQPALYRWWESPTAKADMRKLSEIPLRQRFHAVEQAIITGAPDRAGLVIPERSDPIDEGLEQVSIVICDRAQELSGVGVFVRRGGEEPPRVERATKADGVSGGAVECLKRGMMLAHALDDSGEASESSS